MSEQTQHQDSHLEATEKVLGTPVYCSLPDEVLRIRRNLMLISIVSIFLTLGGLQLQPESSILGLRLSGLTTMLAKNGLLVVTGYLLAHFVWASIESFLEWRLRITGTRVAFVTTARLASESADYPNDPRQSTLYNWWKEEVGKVGSIGEKAQQIEADLRSWETRISESIRDEHTSLNIANACRSIGNAQEEIVKLNRSIEGMQKILESQRVPASLRRFDQWFALFLRSQNLRWLIIDVGAPITLAISAMILLWT